uniref:C2H2-type domain-containing protein n=1 Tax=Oreochromis aureus TaxID=47969 RepID=A0AAZ1XJU9_OREAU
MSPFVPSDLPHVSQNEEEEFCDQESNSSLDQEDPEPPQIKEEEEELFISQEGEQLLLKEEIDTFMVTPAYEGSDLSESESNCDQLLSPSSPETESLNKESFDVASGSTRNAELKPKQSHHRNSDSSLDSVSKCDVCGKDFQDDGNHHRTSEKPYACSTCEKEFYQLYLMKYHQNGVAEEKPFSCETCGRGFRARDKMLIHTRIHTGEKPYLCNACGKSFSQSSALKRHALIHSGEKPYSCKVCGKTFCQSSDLTVHSRIHTGDKPHICKSCGRRFSDASTVLLQSVGKASSIVVTCLHT